MNKAEELVFVIIVVAIIAAGLVFIGMGRIEVQQRDICEPPCEYVAPPDFFDEVSEVREKVISNATTAA